MVDFGAVASDTDVETLVGDNLENLIGAGVVGSRPAFGTAGRLYWATDENILYRDTGAAWVKIGALDLADMTERSFASLTGYPVLTYDIDATGGLAITGTNVYTTLGSRTLGAGTWLVLGSATITRGNTTGTALGRIHDGTSTLAGMNHTAASTGFNYPMTIVLGTTLVGTTTLSFQVAKDVAGTDWTAAVGRIDCLRVS